MDYALEPDVEVLLWRLIQFAEARYVRVGYLYSGSFSREGLHEAVRCPAREIPPLLNEAVARGILAIRRCAREAWELPYLRRVELIEAHGLARAWQREAPNHPGNHPEKGEVALAYRGLIEETTRRHTA